MSGYEVRALEWDTKVFGIPCARLELREEIGLKGLDLAVRELEAYRFVCIANHGCNVRNARLITEHTNAYVSDTNIQFVKNLQGEGDVPGLIEARNNHPVSEQILDIVSSVYSKGRFLEDERLRSLGGQDVYRQWMLNAFNKPDKYFLVDARDGAIRGYLMFSLTGEKLIVELFGIGAKHQHQGIGRRLWKSAEQFAKANEKTMVCVGTQLTNDAAINFYSAMGCKYVACSQIYHWWK